ncbi:MAG: dual OB domain-containing protein [Bryobacteraceae bacterium]
MPSAYSKTIVCLANSRKPFGRCIAGREALEHGYGGWIRPVSVRASAEISLEERRFGNGREPRILDVIGIPMIAAVPKLHQTENHLIDADFYWSEKRALTWADLPNLVERPETLWTNDGSTYHGMNDAIGATAASQLTNSLFLIKPENLHVQVQVEGGMYGPAKRRVRAEFRYNGTGYRFMVTDPIAEQVFLVRADAVFTLKNIYVCVSLTEPFEGDGRCHKLVATIISEGPL